MPKLMFYAEKGTAKHFYGEIGKKNLRITIKNSYSSGDLRKTIFPTAK